MSICTFIAANCPLPEVRPAGDYPLHINIDHGTIDDGDADDNFFLHKLENVRHYTNKEYGVALEWHKQTEGRAKRIIDYIKTALKQTDTVELWHIWLSDYDPPRIRRSVVSVDELTADDLFELDNAEIWTDRFSDTPTWYCLEVCANA